MTIISISYEYDDQTLKVLRDPPVRGIVTQGITSLFYSV